MIAFPKYFETKPQASQKQWNKHAIQTIIFQENDKLRKRGFIPQWPDSIENRVQKKRRIAQGDRE